ncbi:unnamed protein product [Citrullus colocynthis]|uniref:26S proteasome complex subunit SEM1 n=1 Tax=Citrullus colocynthis TaxID=252529 RepID=A0ABP0XYK5_9ROSI
MMFKKASHRLADLSLKISRFIFSNRNQATRNSLDLPYSTALSQLSPKIRVSFVMATELKAASEEVKVDLFEDDDEFEEFEINEEWEVKEGKEISQQWEDDWDDDDVNDDFSLQLKRELENNAEKK